MSRGGRHECPSRHRPTSAEPSQPAPAAVPNLLTRVSRRRFRARRKQSRWSHRHAFFPASDLVDVLRGRRPRVLPGPGRAGGSGRSRGLRLPPGGVLAAAPLAWQCPCRPVRRGPTLLPGLERVPGQSVSAVAHEAPRLRPAAPLPAAAPLAAPRGLYAVTGTADPAPVPPVRGTHRRGFLRRFPPPDGFASGLKRYSDFQIAVATACETEQGR